MTKISNWSREQSIEKEGKRPYYWIHSNGINRVTVKKTPGLKAKYMVYQINRYRSKQWTKLAGFETKEAARQYAVDYMRNDHNFKFKRTYDINDKKAKRVLERAQILDQGDGFTKQELINDFQQKYMNKTITEEEFNALINAGEIFPTGNDRYKVMQ